MTEPDFNFLTCQNERILTELGSLRKDIRGLAIRLEGAIDGLTVEVRLRSQGQPTLDEGSERSP
jgi:hypothetical protein